MRAKLFRNGRSQAVRLPAEFRFEGTEVEVHRDPESGAVVLTPLRPSARDWLAERDRLLAEPGVREENAVRALVDGDSPRLDGWFADQRCCISVIVAAEILYGLEKNALNASKRQLIEKGLAGLEVLPWTQACACVYGRLRAGLQRQGRPLALMELLIASHALSEGCALVTADQAFTNVAELQLESW